MVIRPDPLFDDRRRLTTVEGIGIGSSEFLPDLVVVDEAFGAETHKVIRAAKAAENNGIRSIQILQFNSDSQGEGLDRALLLSALATSNAAIIYCHGISPIQNAAGAGLLIGKNDALKVEEIAASNLHTVSDLALLACSSGRGNPFVGQVTVAHAMAVAGVRTVAFTYWPILQKRGASLAELLLIEDASRPSLSARVARSVDARDPSSAALSLIRP